jgi:arylsulfatase
MRELRLHQPDRPFFLWYASGAPHAPHQAPPEFIERYRGRFDRGWDVWRAETLERQKAMGIVPDDVTLPPLPSWVEPWDTIDAARRRLYARMMEVFAGFVTHVDHHLGRLLANLEELGVLDDTIVCMVSDNGCSAEGGPNGSWNQMRHYISDTPDDLASELAHYDDLGGHRDARELAGVAGDGVAVDQEQRGQREGLTRTAGDAVELELVADCDLLLPAAGLDDGVHRGSP